MFQKRKASSKLGRIPPVIDSRDVLENPRGILAALCNAVGVEFMESMLSWDPGPRETDGVWAPHWYAAVEASTGFAPYKAKTEEVPGHLRDLLKECQRHYDELYDKKLTV